MSPTTSRVLKAITDKVAPADLSDCAGGTVSVVVQLDRAGCPKRVTLRREHSDDIDAQSKPRSLMPLR